MAAKLKAKAGAKTRSARAVVVDDERWELRLYVAGQTQRALQAFAHLKRLCEQHLKGRYTIEVIDLLKNPALASGDQIIAIPTLVRRVPTPMKRIIGDLSNSDRVRLGLNLTPLNTKAS